MNKETHVFLCVNCRKRRVNRQGDWCSCCRYESQVNYTASLPFDDQDWEFAHCEECGSSLDHCGVCRNTSCGASPDLGTDWI